MRFVFKRFFMPKIYDYFGIVFLFYSSEYEPVHVHARYGDYETIFDIIFEDGKVKEIKTRNSKGVENLPPAKFKDASDFVKKYAVEIAMKWYKVFVLKEKVSCEEINKRV